MIRTAFYARESTLDQRDKQTILTQLSMAETFARDNALEIVETVMDNALR